MFEFTRFLYSVFLNLDICLTNHNLLLSEELLEIEGFAEAFERGKQQINKGEVKDWRAIRDDV